MVTFFRRASAACALLALGLSSALCAQDVERSSQRPNVLMIIADDLNHWVGHLGRNPDTRTPNLDALANEGVSFRHAYAAAPTCNPSRTALLSGRRPGTTGVYQNVRLIKEVDWRQYLRDGERLPEQFKAAGYRVFGAGKLYHGTDYFEEDWTQYRPLDRAIHNGPGVDANDGFLSPRVKDLKDEDFDDFHTTRWCGKRIEESGDAPFFLACGLYKPHLAFTVPDRFHDRFAPESVTLPSFATDDLTDVPKLGRARVRGNDFRQIFGRGRWRKVIANYLAAVNYTDENIGYLIEKLRESGQYDNTIIVVFGDHGWHFGEKGQFRKNTLWEEGTRTPYIWRVPGLTPEGALVEAPVDLMSVYPTLMELASIPRPDHVEGQSVATLLGSPEAEWGHPAISTIDQGSNAVRLGPYRLIEYSDGTREFYDHESDPLEWTNRAGEAGYKEAEQRLAAFLPTDQITSAPEMTMALRKPALERALSKSLSIPQALISVLTLGLVFAVSGFVLGRRRA